MTIIVDFGKIIKEMENKEIKLFLFPYEVGRSWFISDKLGNYYQIEPCFSGGYLDKFITNKQIINFNLIGEKSYQLIKNDTKEIYDIQKIKNFIENVVNIELNIKIGRPAT